MTRFLEEIYTYIFIYLFYLETLRCAHIRSKIKKKSRRTHVLPPADEKKLAALGFGLSCIFHAHALRV